MFKKNGLIAKRAPINILHRVEDRKIERIYFINGATAIYKEYKDYFGYQFLHNEVWARKNLMQSDMVFDIPRIYEYESIRMFNDNWLLMQDFGDVTKRRKDIRPEVASILPHLHQLSFKDVPKMTVDYIADIDRKVGEILGEIEEVKAVMRKLGLNLHKIEVFVNNVFSFKENFGNEKVICHGDLNVRNAFVKNKKLILFDWEYVHVNYPYWDIYRLLDGSSKMTRTKVDQSIRIHCIEEYIKTAKKIGFKIPNDFMRKYFLFFAIMVAYILKDYQWYHGDINNHPKDYHYYGSLLNDCFEFI